MKTVAIIGPNGQLGADLVKCFQKANWKVKTILHSEMSIENYESTHVSLSQNKADWVINTAAFHKVDECEIDSEKAWLINATGSANVAKVAENLGMRTVFISSDYVFSGNLSIGDSYTESSPISPINTYGHSKAGGELATLASDERNLVVRVASVFGSAGSSGKGGNFVESILNRAKAGQPLRVVNDLFMSPTYTVDAANLILRALDSGVNGILHGNNSGSATWFDFAKAILELSGISGELTPSQNDFKSNPMRPKNSSLDTGLATSLSRESPVWQDGLARYLLEKGHI